MRKSIILFFILSFFIGLGFAVNDVYCNVAEGNVGISSEDITSSIRNFEKQIKQLVSGANLSVRNKEFEKAEQQLKNVSVLVREEISSYENNARILASKGKKSEERVYRRGISSLEKHVIRISETLQRLGELRKEDEAGKRREESVRYTANGFEYLRAEKLDSAEDSFKKAIKVSSDNRRAKDGLARVERERNRMKDAYISGLLKDAGLNIRGKSFDAAEKKLQEVLKLDPENKTAKKYLNKIKVIKQKEDEKNQKIKRNEMQEQSDEYVSSGINFFNKKEFEKAEESFKKALGLFPENKKAEKWLKKSESAKLKYQDKQSPKQINKIETENKAYSGNEIEAEVERLIKKVDGKIRESKRK